jgi:hypothetical protein
VSLLTALCPRCTIGCFGPTSYPNSKGLTGRRSPVDSGVATKTHVRQYSRASCAREEREKENKVFTRYKDARSVPSLSVTWGQSSKSSFLHTRETSSLHAENLEKCCASRLRMHATESPPKNVKTKRCDMCWRYGSLPQSPLK